MLAFFRRGQGRSSVRRRQPVRRFRVEALEGRNLPTAMGVTLMAQTADAHNVNVSGEVMFFNSPSVCSIVLGGEVNAKLSTDANGYFEYYGPAAGLGTVTAQATDSGGVQVGGSTGIMDSPQPQINGLSIMATGQGKQVEITGSVSAGDVSGLTVTFAGPVGLAAGSTTTDANGDFDLITTATNLGSLAATVTDVWGVQSTWSTTLIVSPPQITYLTAADEGNGIWNFYGNVSGPDVGDDTIQFSGIASGSTTVNANSSYSKELLLNSDNPSGDEYAVATDIWGQTSSQVVFMFF